MQKCSPCDVMVNKIPKLKVSNGRVWFTWVRNRILNHVSVSTFYLCETETWYRIQGIMSHSCFKVNQEHPRWWYREKTWYTDQNNNKPVLGVLNFLSPAWLYCIADISKHSVCKVAEICLRLGILFLILLNQRPPSQHPRQLLCPGHHCSAQLSQEPVHVI